MKKCSKCGGVYPLTTTYWNRDKTNKGGFHNYCKECRHKQRTDAYHNNGGKELAKQHYQNNNTPWIVASLNKRGYPNLTTKQLERIILNFTNSKGLQECAYCKRELINDSMRHIDHFVPYSKEQSSPLTNLIVACKYCNRSKAHDEFKEWYRNQYFYDAIREAKLLEYVEGKRLKRFYT